MAKTHHPMIKKITFHLGDNPPPHWTDDPPKERKNADSAEPTPAESDRIGETIDPALAALEGAR